MNVTLIRIDALDGAGGAAPVRLASHDIPEACHLGGEEWEPAIATLPDFALDFFGGGFAGQITAPRTSFAVATSGLARFAASGSARPRFADARVRIWSGDITSGLAADLGPLTLRFDGRITTEPQIDEAARLASFEAAVRDSWADDSLLKLFAGTGGIEGPTDLTGQPKPLTLGNLRFAGGTLIDRVDNVWAVSDGQVQAVNAAYDRLASLGPSAGNFADLAGLLAASIPNGSWATCLAQGLVRFGAPPDGRVSFDVSGSNVGTGGYVRRPGAIIRRLAERAGGTVNAASLAALDTARPYNLQLQLREQTTAREVIAQIADSVAAVAGVSLTGELFAQPLAIGTPAAVIAGDDSSALRVAAVEELPIASPAWKLATEAELTFELHTADEAAFAYRWQGEYSPTRVYRMDDVVTGPDGAAWAFINTAPASGQALPVWPTAANAWWENFSPPIDPAAIGVEPGADVTAGKISAGIVGQGPSATDPRGLDALFDPAANLVYDAAFRLGGAQWSLGGAWAPVLGQFGEGTYGLSTIGGTNQATSPTFLVQPGVGLYLSLDLFAGGMSAGNLAADIEWLNAGGGVIGASARVTAVNGTSWQRYQSGVLIAPPGTAGGRVRIFTEAATNTGAAFKLVKVSSVPNAPFSDEATFGARYWGGPAIDELRPGEVNANRTEGRISAGIVGQGPFATTPIPLTRVGLLDDQGQATSRRINSQIMASGVLQLLDTNPLSASTDGSGVSTISIAAHVVYDDVGTLSFSSASIGGLAPSTLYYVYENNPGFVGGARSYVATADRTALATFGRRFVGHVTTPPVGNPPSTGGGGGGAGGWPGSQIP